MVRRPSPATKPAVIAAGKQQRLLVVIGIGFDRAKEDHMIAAIVPIDGTALKIGDALSEHRRIAKPGTQSTPVNLSSTTWQICSRAPVAMRRAH